MYWELADGVDPKEETDFIRKVFELGTWNISSSLVSESSRRLTVFPDEFAGLVGLQWP
jgi:hypothetical protein